MPSRTWLQKAAVLLAALDRQAADCLLEQLPAERAARLRQAMLEVDTAVGVQAGEVIEEFLECALDECLPTGGAADSSEPAGPWPDRELAGEAAGAGLPAEEMLEALADEQPQLIAATLAGAPPVEAAELLDRMPVELQAEVLRRMARMDRLPSKWPGALWEELRRRQQAQSGAPARFARQSVDTVRRILQAHGSAGRALVLEHLTRMEPKLAEKLADLEADAPTASARGVAA